MHEETRRMISMEKTLKMKMRSMKRAWRLK